MQATGGRHLRECLIRALRGLGQAEQLAVADARPDKHDAGVEVCHAAGVGGRAERVHLHSGHPAACACDQLHEVEAAGRVREQRRRVALDRRPAEEAVATDALAVLLGAGGHGVGAGGDMRDGGLADERRAAAEAHGRGHDEHRAAVDVRHAQVRVVECGLCLGEGHGVRLEAACMRARRLGSAGPEAALASTRRRRACGLVLARGGGSTGRARRLGCTAVEWAACPGAAAHSRGVRPCGLMLPAASRATAWMGLAMMRHPGTR